MAAQNLLNDRTVIVTGGATGIGQAFAVGCAAQGANVVVGVNHHSCGGCHMKLSRGVVVACQSDQEIVTCPNCNRILYFTLDMDLAVAE